MERQVRHDGESRDTDRLTWSRHRQIFGGQGVRREAGPAATRPAGVVRSVALSRLRLPSRSFTFALISSGCAGALAAWPTACVVGSWIAGILVRILDTTSPVKVGSAVDSTLSSCKVPDGTWPELATASEEISRIDRSSCAVLTVRNPSPSRRQVCEETTRPRRFVGTP